MSVLGESCTITQAITQAYKLYICNMYRYNIAHI